MPLILEAVKYGLINQRVADDESQQIGLLKSKFQHMTEYIDFLYITRTLTNISR